MHSWSHLRESNYQTNSLQLKDKQPPFFIIILSQPYYKKKNIIFLSVTSFHNKFKSLIQQIIFPHEYVINTLKLVLNIIRILQLFLRFIIIISYTFKILQTIEREQIE